MSKPAAKLRINKRLVIVPPGSRFLGKETWNVDELVLMNQPTIPASKIQQSMMLSAERPGSSEHSRNGLVGNLASRFTNEATRELELQDRCPLKKGRTFLYEPSEAGMEFLG